MNNKCENCDYSKLLAAVFDIHILEDDCWLEECEAEKRGAGRKGREQKWLKERQKNTKN